MTKWVNLYSVFFSLKVSFFFYMSNEECIPFSQYIWKAFILHFQMNVEALYKYWLSCTTKFNIRFEEILLQKNRSWFNGFTSEIVKYYQIFVACDILCCFISILSTKSHVVILGTCPISAQILITITYILSSFTLFKH